MRSNHPILLHALSLVFRWDTNNKAAAIKRWCIQRSKNKYLTANQSHQQTAGQHWQVRSCIIHCHSNSLVGDKYYHAFSFAIEETRIIPQPFGKKPEFGCESYPVGYVALKLSITRLSKLQTTLCPTCKSGFQPAAASKAITTCILNWPSKKVILKIFNHSFKNTHQGLIFLDKQSSLKPTNYNWPFWKGMLFSASLLDRHR